MKYKYIVECSYDGSSYKGYLKQSHANTIQNKMEEAFKKLNHNKKVHIFHTSRTDAGVHANVQYIQVNLEKMYEVEILKHKLNLLLPNNIFVKNVFSDFEEKINVRYDVCDKTYKYIINLDENPFLINYSFYIKEKLDVKLMKYVSEDNIESFLCTLFSNTI